MVARIKPVPAGEHSLAWEIGCRGHNKKTFAKAAGLSMNTITTALSGETISPRTAKKIADALGMKPEELFDFE